MVISFLVGCAENKEKISTSDIEFNVNKNLLSEEISDSTLGIIFSIPKNVERLEGKNLEAFHSQINNEIDPATGVKYSLQYIFFNDSTRSLFSVINVTLLDSLIPKYDRQKVFNDFLISSIDTNKTKTATFTKDEIKIYQYLTQHNDIISFKLTFLTSNYDLLQFDYISRKENYPNEIKAIESSIGSIKLINKK